MKNKILRVLAFFAMVASGEALSSGGMISAVPINVAATSDGSVLVYLGAVGPNICGGAQGDFVVPITVSDAARSRMLSVALAAKSSQSTLYIYYDGTCVGGRHVAYIVVM